ncbi:recombination directionality factor [Streptomyces sp. NPDC055099]
MAKQSIWASDEENKPKERQTYSDDSVGRLHSGASEVNEQGKTVGVALTEWRFTTGEKHVAEAAAQLFGGTPVEDEESTSENFIDVFTSATKIPVIMAADGIHWDMKQWINGKLKHHCDGFNFVSHKDEEKIGRECGCPSLFAERKEAARDDDGPNPSITVTFKLADDPELGKFTFHTGAWTLLAVLHEAEDALARIGQGGPVLAELELEYVEFIPKKGKMKGKTVSYTKPVIRVIKSYNDAIADER